MAPDSQERRANTASSGGGCGSGGTFSFGRGQRLGLRTRCVDQSPRHADSSRRQLPLQRRTEGSPAVRASNGTASAAASPCLRPEGLAAAGGGSGAATPVLFGRPCPRAAAVQQQHSTPPVPMSCSPLMAFGSVRPMSCSPSPLSATDATIATNAPSSGVQQVFNCPALVAHILQMAAEPLEVHATTRLCVGLQCRGALAALPLLTFTDFDITWRATGRARVNGSGGDGMSATKDWAATAIQAALSSLQGSHK